RALGLGDQLHARQAGGFAQQDAVFERVERQRGEHGPDAGAGLDVHRPVISMRGPVRRTSTQTSATVSSTNHTADHCGTFRPSTGSWAASHRPSARNSQGSMVAVGILLSTVSIGSMPHEKPGWASTYKCL